MKRFIVQADDDLLRRVKKRAAQRGVSVAEVVRDALERALGDGDRRPVPLSIGKFSSGRTNKDSERASDEFVAEPYVDEP
jgi:plasmid stability protein